jgi:hypothetical protein
MTLFSLTEAEDYITDISIRKRNKMKTLEEINNEIKALQRKMNQLFSKKDKHTLYQCQWEVLIMKSKK